MATSFSVESTVRGHHVYKTQWTPIIGEDLCVQIEEHNTFDRFAVLFYIWYILCHVFRIYL